MIARVLIVVLAVLNLGAARTATIAADALPTGMTLVGSPSVALAANEAKTVEVTLQLDGGVYGYGQPLELRATAPGGLTSSTAMTVTVVKSGGGQGTCRLSLNYVRKVDLFGITTIDIKTNKEKAIPFADYR